MLVSLHQLEHLWKQTLYYKCIASETTIIIKVQSFLLSWISTIEREKTCLCSISSFWAAWRFATHKLIWLLPTYETSLCFFPLFWKCFPFFLFFFFTLVKYSEDTHTKNVACPSNIFWEPSRIKFFYLGFFHSMFILCGFFTYLPPLVISDLLKKGETYYSHTSVSLPSAKHRIQHKTNPFHSKPGTDTVFRVFLFSYLVFITL